MVKLKRHTESGVALISAVLVMTLMAGILVGFVALVVADQRASRSSLDQGEAYAAGHAGLEKLTADLDQLFRANFNPTAADIQTLYASGRAPSYGGMQYVRPDGQAGYRVSFTPGTGGNPTIEDPDGSTISEGPYQGLIGLITPYTIDVTARTPTGAEANMSRKVQTVAIPVFQFGIFSENDLSFFAGPPFNFGGRVHTNQNLFLAEGNPATNELILADRVTAVGEVVRSHLANGRIIDSTSHEGTVKIATQKDGCDNTNSATCVALTFTDREVHQGSVILDNAGSNMATMPFNEEVEEDDGRIVMRLLETAAPNADAWGSVVSTYGGFLLNGTETNGQAARRLELPIVDPDAGATPIDLIRRPKAGDPTGPGATYNERFFKLASIRILLSDMAADITGLPGVSADAPVNLANLGVASTDGSWYVVNQSRPPLAKSAGTTGMTDNKPLVTGFLKVDRITLAGVPQDVTREFLNLGIAGRVISNSSWNTPSGSPTTCAQRNANAILRFQRLIDDPSDGTTCGRTSGGTWTNAATDYMPLALYDAREGSLRDTVGTSDAQRNSWIHLAGIMHYVELDVDNLRRWLIGEIGSTGSASTMNITGYVVYFSDRRGNYNAANPGTSKETGELGYEDFVVDNNELDVGEDVNGNGVREDYGETARPPDGALDYLLNPSGGLMTRIIDVTEARRNPPAFFRRALKLVNGGLGKLPSNGEQGLTVASENPVYVEGNYNACNASPYVACSAATGFDGTGAVGHKSAAIIADAVTLLSRNWNDIRSFLKPHRIWTDSEGDREAETTWYRMAIIAGKGLNFPHMSGQPDDFGTDGGAHNFLRYIENWDGQTLNYRGSIVSLFTSRQAVGTFKCCGNVYRPPSRGYKFDVEFLDPNLLPPRTPMFRDINVLTFRQSFSPTQQ